MSIYHNHYSKKGFWCDYYRKHGVDEHDWLLEFKDLKDIFRIAEIKEIPKQD